MEVGINSTLIIDQLILLANLGWSVAEREHAREIYVDIHIHYLELPEACNNDELDDTNCYYKIALALQAVCEAKPYKLLELLAHDLFKAVKNCLNNDVSVTLSVAKNKPMDNLQQARFVISDK